MASKSTVPKPKQGAGPNVAQFARFEAVASSTPTGTFFTNSSAGNLSSQWHGPFAVARQMIENREAALEERLQDSANGSELVNADDKDEVSQQLKEVLARTPEYFAKYFQTMTKPNTSISTLQQHCLKILAANFQEDQIAETTAYLTAPARIHLSYELAKLRRLSNPLALALAAPNSDSFVLHDCSAIDQETLLRCVEKINNVRNVDSAGEHEEADEKESSAKISGSKHARSSEAKTKKGTAVGKKGRKSRRADTEGGSDDEDDDDDDADDVTNANDTVMLSMETASTGSTDDCLQTIVLRNCGYGFTDTTAAVFMNYITSVQNLELTGCYCLSEEALRKLVSYSSTKQLRNVNLSCCVNISRHVLSELGSNAPQTRDIQTLVLDNSNYLSDEEIMGISSISTLTKLSLCGLENITDESVVHILECIGGRLTHLNLSRCSKLTDTTVFAIRKYCARLQYLDISHDKLMTNGALYGLFLSGGSISANPGDASAQAAPTVIIESVSVSSKKTARKSASKDSSKPVEAKSTSVHAQLESANQHHYHESIGELEYLGLAGLSNAMTDDIVVEVCRSYGQTLRSLDASGCNKITNKSLVAMGMFCPRLKEVNLSFTRQWEDRALCYLVLQLRLQCHNTGSDTDMVDPFHFAPIFPTTGVGAGIVMHLWGCTQVSKRLYAQLSSNVAEVRGR